MVCFYSKAPFIHFKLLCLSQEEIHELLEISAGVHLREGVLQEGGICCDTVLTGPSLSKCITLSFED